MEDSYVVRSPLPDIEIPNFTLHELAFSKFQTFGSKIALTDGPTGKQYTFKQILRMSKNTTSGLAENRVRKNDVVAIFSPNSIEYIVMQLGALAAGATVTTINSGCTAYEAGNQLKQSNAKYLFVAEELFYTAKDAVRRIERKIKIIVNGKSTDYVTLTELMKHEGQFPSTLTFDPDHDLAALFYSSGTTGLPKGVMMTHRNLVANFFQQTGHEDLISPSVRKAMMKSSNFQRVVLGHVSMSHMYGNCTVQLYTLIQGGRIICLPKYTPKAFLSGIEKYKVRYLPLVPPLALFIAKSPLVEKYDLTSVLSASCGAAPLTGDIQKETCRKLGISKLGQEYGLTEAMCVTSSCFAEGFGIRQGSVGLLLPNTHMKIIDSESGRCLGPHEKGEILIHGPQVMKGYLNNPEATRKALDSSGWLHTGDIGYCDEKGYIYIVDRVKDIIKYKGFQVSPAEIEGLLINHVGIEDAAVIGVPDSTAGEVPKAFIVRKLGANITREEIHSYVKVHLSAYKQLRGGIEFVENIPKSPSGKILRNQLKRATIESKL